MMSSAFSTARAAAALAVILACVSAPASAQTQADLFDDSTLHTVEIVMGWKMSEARRRKLFWDNAVRYYARCGLS